MNNQKLSFIGLSIIIIFTVSSCQKRPEAGFQTDLKAKYTDEEIIFTNTTDNGYSFLWDFGDGITSEETNAVHVYKDKGNYTVKLSAFSKNKRKSDNTSETVKIFRKKEIKINDKSYPLDKGYLVSHTGADFDIILVNTNIYISSNLSVYVYDRNKSGQILLMTLNCADVNNLEEGNYTSSDTEGKTFVGSYMLLNINYFSGDYLYYECLNGTVEINLTGITYELDINMTTTEGENVSAYYLGHLTNYHNKAQKETDKKELLNFLLNKE